jgi:IS30 family transposase
MATQKVLHHETIYRYIYRHEAIADRQTFDDESLTQYPRIRHRKHYKKRGKLLKRQLMAPATRSKSGQH